ncbi:hypothetical protein PENCOP_c009G00386 [Penicillium coprophilum]|uniref:Uncharacterized protein n=1 Tax=Penicillium coprophilum TaxID=36646 RepID=A0A1V6UI81_9EURO|nr:hypothetical protein PENCOP_c009G00386 [Penicillium coprophilum]
MQRAEEQMIQQMAPTAYDEAVRRNEKIQARKRHEEEWRIQTLAIAHERTSVHGNTASVSKIPSTAQKGPKYHSRSGSKHGSGGGGTYSGGGSSSNDSDGGGFSGGSTGDSGSSGDSGGCGDGGGGCGD